MKKVLVIIAVIVAVVIVIGAVSSGSKTDTNTNTNTTTDTAAAVVNEENDNTEKEKLVETEDEKVKQITAGEKIVTANKEITINSVELTYDVLPDDTSGYYNHYEAETGKVYISVDADVYNNAKQNLACDNIGGVVADYNDGYTYSGFVVVEDSSNRFTYANITSITPLETRGIRWLIECPQEVDETENPLVLEFTIDNEKYEYVVR